MDNRKKYEGDLENLLYNSKCIKSNLFKEWHPTKNGDLKPTDVTRGSGKKMWWVCEKGHEWQATINNRSKGHNCPYCGERKLLRGYNDLATTNPTLTKEWNYAKNGDLTPSDVFPNSNKKVWWMCDKGHEWEAIINSRNKGNNCPYCGNKKLLKGYNDLVTIDSKLAEQWHPTKNGNLTPTDVFPNSSKKVWWQCDKGHEWKAIVNNRNKGTGCPYCTNRKVLKGCNDLATTNPTLAAQWHVTKNNNLTPSDVTAGSGRKVWWQCDKGHEWHATVNNRSKGRDCPICRTAKTN